MAAKSLYKVLQVDREASPAVIEAAYRRLLKELQPGANTMPASTVQLHELEEAYSVLSDPVRRSRYDIELDGAGSVTISAPGSTTSSQNNSALAPQEATVLFCANHPNVETLLRCNRCSKPICIKCAVQTPVGFRCRECVRQQQNVYFNAETWDNPIAFVVSLLVTLIATPLVGAILGRIGFFGILIAIFIGASAGGILAQIIRRAVGRRRGRYLRYFALAGILLGALAGSFLAVPLVGVFPLFSIPMLVFAFLAITTAYQVLR
jgi:hypothetical protein